MWIVFITLGLLAVGLPLAHWACKPRPRDYDEEWLEAYHERLGDMLVGIFGDGRR